MEKNEETIHCILCGKIYSNQSSTGTLRRHLIHEHYEEVKKQLKEILPPLKEEGDPQEECKDSEKVFANNKGKTKSSVWQFMARAAETEIINCTLCGKKYSNTSSTGTLKKHLEKEHYEAWWSETQRRSRF